MRQKNKNNFHKHRSSSKEPIFGQFPYMRSDSNSSTSSDSSRTSWSSNDMVGMSRWPSASSSLSAISKASTESAHDTSFSEHSSNFSSTNQSFSSSNGDFMNATQTSHSTYNFNESHSDSDKSVRNEFYVKRL